MGESTSACGLVRSSYRHLLHIFPVCYLLIAGLFFITPFGQTATAATYYVDAIDGDDSNPGTEAQPWKTIARAQNYKTGYIPQGYDPMVQSGDTVIIRNGNYGTFDESDRNNPRLKWYITHRNDWITYRAAPGHTPVLTSIVIYNEDVWNVPQIFGASYLKFEGFRITDAVYLQFTSYFQASDCNITGPIESYAGFYAPYFPFNSVAISANGCKHITIEDCDISRTYRCISIAGANGVTVRNNLIHYFGEDGITAPGDNITIDKNTIYDVNIYSTVIDMYGTKTGTFDVGETVYSPEHPTVTGIVHWWTGNYLMIYPTSEITFYDYFKNDPNFGLLRPPAYLTFTIVGEESGATLTSLITVDPQHNDAIAIHGTHMSNIVITNNIYVGPQMKLATYDGGIISNITIANNLSYVSIPPIGDVSMYMATEPVSGSPVATWTNVNICNNTFYSRKVLVRNSVKIENFYNNILRLLMYEPEHGALIANHGNNIFTEDPGTFKNDTELVTSTPGFVNAANNDFNLTPNSAAINFGNPTYAPATDILGRSRIGNPDAGCYEYHGPVLDNIGDQSVFVNNLLTFSINATDPDGDRIIFSAQNLPSGATFAGQTFSWTPTGGQVGTYKVTFIAGDGSEQDSETITITVKSTNQAPTANAGPDQTVTDSDGNGSQQVTLNGSGSTDSDGTIQSYVWSEGGTQIATGVTPTVTLAVGQHTITLTVTDNGGLTDTDAVVITVNESGTNQPPIANAGRDQAITDSDGNGSEQVTLNGSGSSDPGGTIQSYVWREGGSQIATGANPTVTLSVGQHTITLTVADNGGLTDTDTVTITVNASSSTDNNPPSVTNCSPQRDSVQVPLNNLITLHIVDAGKGVDANSVTIKVNSNTVYSGNTANYTSATGNCRRTGTKSDYTFVYQPNEMFDFEQKITVTVNATDLGGNSMPEYTYSFWTEMRSFGKNKRVSLGLDNLGSAAPATVRDSNGNIYAVWHAGPPGSRDIYVNKLADEAANFTGSIQLIADPADQCNPAIAMDGNDRLYVTWQDNRRGNWDVYLCSSADGVNWSAASRISDSNDSETNPAIAVGSAGGAGIVWQQDDQTGNPDIHIASSSDGFATKAISQITANASDQTDPAIAVNSANTVYVVWTDKRNGSNDIYGAASNSGPWTNVPIVNKAGNQSSPAIAAETAGSILHLLWVDDASGNSDIYYAAINGLPSSPLTGSSIIDDSSGRNQVEPAIAVTGSTGNNLKVFACWQDWRNVVGASGDTDLYFAEVSSDGGTNVFVGDDSTNSNQSQPAIGVDAQGHPYLVWGDSRSANAQIYYAGSTYLDNEAVDSELVAASAGATVGVNPANIDSVDDVSVTVPAGACPCDIRITISEIKNPQEFTVPCLAAYDFGPSGIQFNQPVTITIPYAFPASQGSVTPYWFNSLTGALSQQGITDIKDIVISPTLHAVSFKTTHFTPFYVVEGTAGGTGGGGGGGGCSVSATGNGSIVEFLLPYMALAAAMMILRLRDARQRKERRLTKSES